LLAPQVESLTDLEEVKEKMKSGDSVEVNLDGQLRKDDDSVDMDKVHKLADFLKAANNKGVGVTKLYLRGKRRKKRTIAYTFLVRASPPC